jgi:hypothetical protein
MFTSDKRFQAAMYIVVNNLFILKRWGDNIEWN